MGMSATPSQGEDEIHVSKHQKEVPPEPKARRPTLLSTEGKQQPFPLLLVCFSTLL